jgi:hypothetical protein
LKVLEDLWKFRSICLRPTDRLPLQVELEQYLLSSMSFEIQQKDSGGPDVSMKVIFWGEERDLSFWHGRDPKSD